MISSEVWYEEKDRKIEVPEMSFLTMSTTNRHTADKI